MTPPRAASAELVQTPAVIAAALETFLAEHPKAVVVEDGKVLFDMRMAKYSLATEHGKCTLQLWGEERNIVLWGNFRNTFSVFEITATRDIRVKNLRLDG